MRSVSGFAYDTLVLRLISSIPVEHFGKMRQKKVQKGPPIAGRNRGVADVNKSDVISGVPCPHFWNKYRNTLGNYF